MTEENKQEETLSMSAIEAFYHLFTISKFPDESDEQFEERKITRELFTEQLKQQGLTPESYFSLLQRNSLFQDKNFEYSQRRIITDEPLINKLIKRVQ
jgi:hypothetical protein